VPPRGGSGHYTLRKHVPPSPLRANEESDKIFSRFQSPTPAAEPSRHATTLDIREDSFLSPEPDPTTAGEDNFVSPADVWIACHTPANQKAFTPQDCLPPARHHAPPSNPHAPPPPAPTHHTPPAPPLQNPKPDDPQQPPDGPSQRLGRLKDGEKAAIK